MGIGLGLTALDPCGERRLKQQGQEGAAPRPWEDSELEQGPQLSDALVDWLRALGCKRLGDQLGTGLAKDFANRRNYQSHGDCQLVA